MERVGHWRYDAQGPELTYEGSRPCQGGFPHILLPASAHDRGKHRFCERIAAFRVRMFDREKQPRIAGENARVCAEPDDGRNCMVPYRKYEMYE